MESSEIINVLEKEWNGQLRPLAERLRSGDPEAITEFVMQYQQRVRSVAMDVLMDADLAIKATSATFRNAILQLQNGVETRQVEPWLLWIARNEALALTQVVSAKQRINAQAAAGAPTPMRVGRNEPEDAGEAVRRTNADRGTTKTNSDAINPSSMDARILSFLGTEPSQQRKDRRAQISAGDAVVPEMTNAYEEEMLRTTRMIEPTEPERKVANGQEYWRDDVSARERTAELTGSFADTGTTAQDDAQWRIRNRERKRLQGLESENYIPSMPAEDERAGEYRAEKPKATFGDVLLTGCMASVALLLLWIVLGLLRNNGVLNLPDFGYGWFNENIFYLF